RVQGYISPHREGFELSIQVLQHGLRPVRTSILIHANKHILWSKDLCKRYYGSIPLWQYFFIVSMYARDKDLLIILRWWNGPAVVRLRDSEPVVYQKHFQYIPEGEKNQDYSDDRASKKSAESGAEY